MQQYPIKVTYKNNVVGDYYADLYIVDKIIIEIKAVNEITSIHKAQILNYLKAIGIKLGVLVNFSRERNTVYIERIPNLISKVMNSRNWNWPLLKNNELKRTDTNSGECYYPQIESEWQGYFKAEQVHFAFFACRQEVISQIA